MAEKYKLRAKLGISKGKTIWRDIGVVIIEPGSGRCKVKLDLIPAGEWDGWLMGFEADKEKDHEWEVDK